MTAPCWTEKKIEDWLKPETRPIVMPDGVRRAFSSTRIMWQHHDYLTEWGYSTEDLVDLAIIDGREMNRPFDLSFPHVISYITRRYRERFGEA